MKQYPDSSRFKKWKPPYTIVLDTTTFCNAKCPQCSRINSKENSKLEFAGKTLKSLPLIHVSFEKIKKTFNEKSLNTIGQIQLCPTWGDHMMHPHALEIVEYFLSTNKWITVVINTNGSMRDEEYWWNLCALSMKYKSRLFPRKRLKIVFAVDGIDQEMHGLYRRNTNLQKVLNHIKICSEFEDAIDVSTQTVVFKHNQEHLKQIADLCKEYGSEKHTSVVSDRFINDQSENKNTYNFYDENNNKLQLHKVTNEWLANFKKDGALNARNLSAELTNKPTCGWSLTNALQINFDGNVWPCCYFGNSAVMQGEKWKNHHEFIKEYYNYNNNIYDTELKDILSNGWWQKLPYVLELDNTVRNCIKHCTSRIANPESLRLNTIL